MTSNGVDVTYLEEDEIEDKFISFIDRARKKARTQTLVSGCLLPVTLAIDTFVVVPLFLFEINLAYFSVQAAGSQKAKLLTGLDKKKPGKDSGDISPGLQNNGANNQQKEKTGSIKYFDDQSEEQALNGMRNPFGFQVVQPGAFDKTIEHLYNICFNLDPLKFPLKDTLPTPTYLPSKDIATALLDIFRNSLPPEVMARHELDEQRAAEDLDRAMRKAAKEYVSTVKNARDMSPFPSLDFLTPKSS